MSKKKYCLRFFVFTGLFLIILSSTLADSLVSIADLTYHSKFEEQVFQDFFVRKNPDYFALYLSVDSSVKDSNYKQYKQRFNQLIDIYRQPQYQKMKPAKFVKKVYKNIHELMLDKYVIPADFSSIFKNREYQCVASSMLYALAFNDLDVSFEIKELSDHVYLTAYPATLNILVETTNPLKGTAVYDGQFKKNFVEYLKGNKLIGIDEYETTDLDELFEKYYLRPEVVNETELAGIQYYNKALFSLQNLDFVEAFHLMEKAYLLHPNKRNSFVLLFTLANAIDHLSITDEKYATYVGKLCRFHGKTISTDQLISAFVTITSRQLNYEGDEALYDSSYYLIVSEIADSALRDEISFIYYSERGRMLFNQARYIDAKQYLEKAYGLKQKNIDAENLFVASITSSSFSFYSLSNEDVEQILKEFDNYLKAYPNLKNHIKFKELRLALCLNLMDNYFYSNKVVKAEFYRSKFEQDYPSAEINLVKLNNEVPKSYASGASYYFKRGNYRQARKLLNKGLEYAPNNYMLKSRLNALN